MNADRITLLSVLIGVALMIAFGIEGLSWWQRAPTGVVSLAGAALGLHVLFSHERLAGCRASDTDHDDDDHHHRPALTNYV
jgi:hypothetical protein